MATITLAVNHFFAVGEEVGVYPDTSVSPTHTGSPHASALASGTVDAEGNLTITDDDLVAGGRYVAAADIAVDDWRYIFFNADALVETPVTQAQFAAHSAAVQEQIAAAELLSQGEVQELVDSGVDSANAYTDAPTTTNVQTGTSYTPVDGDQLNIIVELTNNSEVTITLPDEPTFEEGAQIEFCALGIAGATFVAGSGATVDSAGGLVDLEQDCYATARHRGGGQWHLAGQLA